MPIDSSDGFDPSLVEAWQAMAGPQLDLRARWFSVAEEIRLSPAGLDALLKINPEQPPSMRQLAEQLGCDASYVTTMIDDLEASRYAERRPSDSDRRVKNIALTAAGRRARDLALGRLMAPPAQLRTLSKARQQTLARLLRQAFDEDADARP